jgi:cytoskeletal protein RodZ
MQTIGEKIEETRKRKGISLSEAAEATKIRRDFLLNIESNEYGYDLPEIYKRGFIKNYAKYLKLNPEKVLSQYQEQLITHSSRSKKPNTDLFNSNSELNPSAGQGTLDPLLDKPSLGKINLNKPAETAEATPTSEETIANKELYIKTAILGIVTLLFVFGIFWLIQTISQSMNPNKDAIANTTTSATISSITQTSEPSKSTEYPIEEITLKASGSVYVQIRQKLDNKLLLSKQLIEGEIQTIKRRGPVDVAFTKGNFVTLFTDGEVEPFQPNTNSAGKITLP